MIKIIRSISGFFIHCLIFQNMVGTIKVAVIFTLVSLHQMELFIILMNLAFMLTQLTGNNALLLT